MDSGESGNLNQLQDLVADLGGPLSSVGLLGWVTAGELSSVPDEVFAAVRDAGLLAARDPRLSRPARGPRAGLPQLSELVTIPADADELMSRLWEIDEDAALPLLVSLAESNRPSRQRQRMLRRQWQEDPQDVFAELARLAGPGFRWWTNTDLTSWNPVTQHTFDAVIVGAGNGVIVTLIAFDGGE
jgi:hypothetical protein